MKKLLILGLLLILPSCTQFRAFEDGVKSFVSKVTKPDTFDDIRIAFNGVEASGVTYRDLCQRKIINKSCWNVITQLQPYEAKAYFTYKELRDFVKANPNADATTFITSAKAAIVSLKSFQTQFGVK